MHIPFCYINPYTIKSSSGYTFQLQEEESDFKTHYKDLEIEYPKFYKMDRLSKMAFIALNHLTRETDFEQFGDDEIHMIFGNTSASTFVDQLFSESYSLQKSPSPSLFVYTLPNILTGELAIFKKWYGENCFYVCESFDPILFKDQIAFAFHKGAKGVLCGWVESIGNKHEALMFFVKNPVSELEIIELYNNLEK